MRSELFFVYGVGCSHFYVVFVFLQQTFILCLFYIISRGIFHIGGLVSKCTSEFTGYLRNGSASVFCFLHLLCTILGL